MSWVCCQEVLNKPFDAHVQGGEVEVYQRRVGSIIPLQFSYKYGKEQEGGRWSDVDRIFASEIHVLVVEGRPHLHGEASHNVLDQGLGEGKALEVLHVVELLDDL